jgi:hypothetical protein
MYAIVAVVTGLLLCVIARRRYGSFFSPLGIYSGIWAMQLTVYWVMSNEPNSIFFELSRKTQSCIGVAWIAWAVGCEGGYLVAFLRKGRVVADREFWTFASTRRVLKRATLVGTLIGAIAPILSYWGLRNLGLLATPGNAWREFHINGDALGSIGGILGKLATPLMALGTSSLYAVLALSLLGYLVYRLSVIRVMAVMVLGAANDYFTGGRYWLVYSCILSAILVVMTLPLVRSLARKHSTVVNRFGGNARRTRRYFSERAFRMRIAFLLVGGGLCFIVGILSVSSIRTSVTAESEHLEIMFGAVPVRGIVVGFVKYLGLPIGLLNYYVTDGIPWGPIHGQLGIGGLSTICNYFTLPFLRINLIAPLGAYMENANSWVQIGPTATTNFLGTYLLAALSDFSWLGLVIYPAAIGSVTTYAHQLHKLHPTALSAAIYALLGLVISTTVFRWEGTWPTLWMAAGFIALSFKFAKRA